MKASKVVFNVERVSAEIFHKLSIVQTRLLADYAAKKIQEIGNTIASYHSRHHMDRTGNLLDSLCWGVSYRGRLVEFGFYRKKQATEASGLHEWWWADWKDGQYWTRLDQLPDEYQVQGHELAEAYLNSYGNNDRGNGWKVFFAILAPYWGYWEQGFTLHHGLSQRNGFQGATFVRFAVMTEYRDQVKADLKPARVRFSSKAAPYTNLKLFKKAKKYYTHG